MLQLSIQLLISLVPNHTDTSQAPQADDDGEHDASETVPPCRPVPVHQRRRTRFVGYPGLRRDSGGNDSHQCKSNSLADLADRVEDSACEGLSLGRED